MKYISTSGIHVYNKPLHPKKKAFLMYIVIGILVFFVAAYLLYVFVLPVERYAKKKDSDFSKRPVVATRLVDGHGYFSTGIFQNELTNVNYEKAKVFSFRKYLPFVYKLSHKQLFSMYIIKRDYYISLHLEDFSSIREMKYFSFDYSENKVFTHRIKERYTRKLNIDDLFRKASFKIGPHSMSAIRNSYSTKLDLHIEDKSIIRLDSRNMGNMLNYMVNWTQNRAMYNSVRVEEARGEIEVPGKMLKLEKGDLVIYHYQAGVAPMKYIQNRLFAVLTSNDKMTKTVLSVVFNRPKGLSVADAYYLHNGSWTAVDDMVLQKDKDNGTMHLVSARKGINLVIEEENRTALSSGIIFPRVSHVERECMVSGSMQLQGYKEHFEGKAIMTRYHCVW